MAAGFALAVALVFVCVQFHPLQTASLAITKQQRNSTRNSRGWTPGCTC